jgi:3'-phosphoadenosine 5'-phosphosulfate sulfotransferase (PAPS reductase)/FAD synthetase
MTAPDSTITLILKSLIEKETNRAIANIERIKDSNAINHVVSISGGVPSAVVAYLVAQKYGLDNLHLVFADTLVEDDDNYRFLNDVETLIGKPITRLVDGRTPLELATSEKFIYNNRIANCTKLLKIKPIREYVKSLEGETVLYLGMDAKDRTKGRLESPRNNWGKLGVSVEYPLIEWSGDIDPHNYIKALAIDVPATYGEGFSNANCLKQGCVKQGAKGWITMIKKRPDAFSETALWEYDMRQRVGNYAMLEKTINGVTNPYPLTELFADYCAMLELARSQPIQLRLFELDIDMSSICAVECGVSQYEYEE